MSTTPDPSMPPDWLPEARVIAAQCWCDPTTSGVEMDVRLAEVFAQRLADWMQEAARYSRNADYWREKADVCLAGTANDRALPRVPTSKHYGTIIEKLATMLSIRQPRDDGFIDSDDTKPFIVDIRQAADALNKERCDAEARIAELQARLRAEQPRAEPVAKVVSKHGDPEAFGEREVRVLADLSSVPYGTKLYAHPAPEPTPAAAQSVEPPTPLSDEEIVDIACACDSPECDQSETTMFARAVAARRDAQWLAALSAQQAEGRV